MSGIEVERCELQKIATDPLDAKNVLETDTNSNRVALDVLNDIVENALDSAMTKEQQALRNFRMVGDIMDQYTPRATKITDLCDASIGMRCQKQHLTSTEEEVKKFIGEMSTNPSSKGTGDQLQESEEVVAKKKSFSFSARNFSIEKKTRLTDLVKTSKSVISKFLSNENAKSKDSEWEERNEEFVRSIELNSLPSNKATLNSSKEIHHSLASSSEDMTKIPDDSGMENINLKDLKERGNDLVNEADNLDYIQKSLTFPIASCSRITTSHHDCKDSNKERKKWNFGTKIVNYIKKRASRKDITKSDT